MRRLTLHQPFIHKTLVNNLQIVILWLHFTQRDILKKHVVQLYSQSTLTCTRLLSASSWILAVFSLSLYLHLWKRQTHLEYFISFLIRLDYFWDPYSLSVCFHTSLELCILLKNEVSSLMKTLLKCAIIKSFWISH